jgi:hypothetical protein
MAFRNRRKHTKRRRNNTHLTRKQRKNRKYHRLHGGDIPANGSKKAVVIVLNSTAGFFAVYHTLLRAYLYAKKLNIPFFVDHDNWQYTYKDGWHDYFKSLNILNRGEHFDSIERFENSANNDIMKEFTVRDKIEAVKETFILNDRLQALVDSYIKEIGGEYTSLYVRRGDKITERALIPLDDILSQTTIKDDGRTIFIQTDDYSVVKDMRAKFPSCKIMTMTKEDASGAANGNMTTWTPEQRKEHTEELLVSCSVSARAKIGWTYYMSNVGNFIKILGYDAMHIYVDDKNTKEEIEKKYALDHKDSF